MLGFYPTQAVSTLTISLPPWHNSSEIFVCGQSLNTSVAEISVLFVDAKPVRNGSFGVLLAPIGYNVALWQC